MQNLVKTIFPVLPKEGDRGKRKKGERKEKEEAFHESTPLWFINFGPNYHMFNHKQYLNSLYYHSFINNYFGIRLSMFALEVLQFIMPYPLSFLYYMILCRIIEKPRHIPSKGFTKI